MQGIKNSFQISHGSRKALKRPDTQGNTQLHKLVFSSLTLLYDTCTLPLHRYLFVYILVTTTTEKRGQDFVVVEVQPLLQRTDGLAGVHLIGSAG